MTVEKISAIVLLLSFTSLCTIAQTVDHTIVSNDFVNDTCKKHEALSKVCIAVIDSDPHQELKLNLSGLLAIFINHTIFNATDNHSYLLEQLKRSDLDNETRHIFNICVEEYERGIDILNSSLEALLKEHDTSLSLSMTDAYHKIGNCEDEFEYSPEPALWLSRYLDLRKLLELAMGTANLIQCNKVAACIP